MTPPPSKHAHRVLRALRTAQHHLQHLATERWSAIDPTDREARERIVAFMEVCDEQSEAIHDVADALETLFGDTLDRSDPPEHETYPGANRTASTSACEQDLLQAN